MNTTDDSSRNRFDELRGSRIASASLSFTAKDCQAIANQLDRWLTSDKKGPP